MIKIADLRVAATVSSVIITVYVEAQTKPEKKNKYISEEFKLISKMYL